MTICIKCKKKNNYLYAGNNNTELNKHHHVYKMSQKNSYLYGERHLPYVQNLTKKDR